MSESTDQLEREKLRLGRELVARWMGLFRALGLYDWRHPAVAAGAERVLGVIRELGDGCAIDLALRQDSIYLDGVRLREGGASATSFQTLSDLLRSARVASFTTDPDVDPEDIQIFGHLVLRVHEGDLAPPELLRELKVHGAGSLGVTINDEPEDNEVALIEGRELHKRVYLRSVGVLKAVFHDARQNDRINLRRVKRVVQQMMESLEEDSPYALSLTCVKNYDEYTFNHSVNVGALTIALGQAIGLPRRQLYIAGQAGMLHDLGKICIPREILNKAGRLTPDERKRVQQHPAEGFVSIATKEGVNAETIGVALGAYEHHLNLDGSGYPARTTNRPISLLSRLVAIVDRYDAMTSARVYRSPMPPAKALSILYLSQRDQLDQTLLRYFMNMLGTFPVGTVVRLSDYSVAIVLGAGSVAEFPHLPRVRLVLDDQGAPAVDVTVDLSASAKDPDALQVTETLQAEDYGIEVMDYLM